MRYIFCLWAAQCPGFMAYLFRRTHEELWKNHMEGPSSFPAILADEVAARKCAIVGKQVRWANGARIFLNHMQLEKHKYKYQGFEMHALGIDEATQFSESMIRYVFASVRLGSWEPPPYFPWRNRLPFILLGANPGGAGHKFLKSRYVDLEPHKIVYGAERGQQGTYRQFIPARAEDNPELLRNDPLYLERLELLGDETLIRALREGDWEILAGAMFGDAFRKNKVIGDAVYEWHVMAPRPIPLGWHVWRGGDDGYALPLAYYWFTKNPDTGTIYVIDELYGTGFSPGEAADRTREKDLKVRYYDHVDKRIVYNTQEIEGDLDSAAFAKAGASELSRAEQMNSAARVNWNPVVKWSGSRVARCQNLHRLLKPNPKERNMKPGIVFFSTCRNAIETIPALLRDEDGDREDIADGQDDHAFDGVTYGTQHEELKSGRVTVRF